MSFLYKCAPLFEGPDLVSKPKVGDRKPFDLADAESESKRRRGMTSPKPTYDPPFNENRGVAENFLRRHFRLANTLHDLRPRCDVGR